MFSIKRVGNIRFAYGDRLQGKVEPLALKIREMLIELGIYASIELRVNSTGWVTFLRNIKAESVCYRDWVHEQEETKDLPVPNSGAHIVLVAKGQDGRYYALVQIRENCQIRFPGGASVMWTYKGKTALEDARLTADREFMETVGKRCKEELVFLDCVTTTNHYPQTDTTLGWPDVYAQRMYYGSETTMENLEGYLKGKGPKEGKIAIVAIEELKDYKQFSNAKPVFRLLKELYS